MLPKEYAQIKKEFSEVERNTWINAYVSRHENPIMLVLYFLAVSAGSFLVFKNYFTTGSRYSIGYHVVALIAFPIVLISIHSILNAVFRKAAVQCCPIEVPLCEIDMKRFDQAYVAETDAILTEYNRLNGLTYPGLDLSPYSLLTPAVFILCFGYFAWIQRIPIPEGCVLYLVAMCVAFVIYGYLVVASSGQSLGVPLSYEVKESIERLVKAREKQQKNPNTGSDTSSDASWYIHQQKTLKEYEERLHEWATTEDPPSGSGDGI